MSHTNTPLPAATAAPVAAPRGPRERRVRFGHLMLAIALIVVGALGTVALVTTVSAGGTYLALAQDVDYGAQITEADLTEVRIPNPPALKPIAASSRNRVIGLYATMPLAEGTLLTAAHLEAEPIPGPNQRIVGLTLRRERLPAQAPRPGDPITLVASAGRGDDESATPQTFPAVVTGVAGAGSGGLLGGGSSNTVTIDVAVSTADAPAVAVLAQDNRLSILLGGS